MMSTRTTIDIMREVVNSRQNSSVLRAMGAVATAMREEDLEEEEEELKRLMTEVHTSILWASQLQLTSHVSV